MRPFILAALAVSLFGCSKPDALEQPTSQITIGPAHESNEARFIFLPPDGFVWNNKHRIWHNKNTTATVELAHSPRKSFQAVVDDFVADHMLAANLEMVSKDIREIDGRPTLLVHGNRLNTKYSEEFCVVAFGTRTGVAQLTAIYPSDMAESLKSTIEESLLTSRYEIPE